MGTKVKEHHNLYFTCPHCNGDDIWLVPPCLGEKSFYICDKCVKQIEPIRKTQGE